MTAIVFAEAEADLEEAFDFYQKRQRDLGLEFLDEFRRGVARILANPNAWQTLTDTYRRYRLHRFPYGIVYRPTSESNQILIVAIMHLSQKPGFWRGRDSQ